MSPKKFRTISGGHRFIHTPFCLLQEDGAAKFDACSSPVISLMMSSCSNAEGRYSDSIQVLGGHKTKSTERRKAVKLE